MSNILRSVVAITAWAVIAAAQAMAQSPLGDYSGEGALLANSNGLLRTNITKGSLGLSYVLMNSSDAFYLGTDASVEVANGLLSALRSGSAQLGGKGSVSVGMFVTSTQDTGEAWLALRAGVGRHGVSLYDPARPAGNRVFDTSFTDASLDLHYNNFSSKRSMFWAVSVGYARTDNSGTVDKVTVTSTTSSTDTTTGTNEVVTSTSDDAVPVSAYRKQETWRLNGDVVSVIVPAKFALHGFVHYEYSAGADELHVGAGLYALTGGDPFASNAGGLVVELVNADGMKSAKLADHVRISLVGSLKIP